ncbi:MAG: NAD-dependent epimerase/dehydratase family protein [Planctomycetota bacterium]|nr:NAD-dependent epimerase/dehydratase family protein [Planctomycetota bacterium]
MPRLPTDDLEHVLRHAARAFESLRDARVFVTGGTGFFGTWLLESFAHANAALKLNARAVVLSRDPGAFAQKCPHLAEDASLAWLRGDVKDFAFPDGAFTHVIHAATEASAKLNAEAPLAMFDTIVAGARRTLDFARASGAKTFLLTSSGAVYGRQPADLTHVPETYAGAPDPLAPASAYGAGKRAAEHLCALYAKLFGLDAKIARCYAFAGPHLPLDAHFAIGNFIRDGLRGQPLSILGDGTPYRSYLYAADLAVWLWTILAEGQTARAYNVGSEEPLTIAETARAVARAFSPEPEVRVAQAPTPGRAPERYVPSTARAREELGLAARISLDEAIRRTVAWHRAAGGRP